MFHSTPLMWNSISSPTISLWTIFMRVYLRSHTCELVFAFGPDPTSFFSGNVRPDKSQCPLHTLFLPILLRCWSRPKVGEEEGELPAGLVDVLTAVHGVEQCLCAVLCPQAAGSQGGGKERRADGCSAGAQPERSIMFGCVWRSIWECAVHVLYPPKAWDRFTQSTVWIHKCSSLQILKVDLIIPDLTVVNLFVNEV